jgi:hypothetical protein
VLLRRKKTIQLNNQKHIVEQKALKVHKQKRKKRRRIHKIH